MANQMISAFTPSLMSSVELETIFVKRQALAQEIFEKIILSATTEAKHYALLVGMRGMGKTHLVALIYYRLLAEFKQTPELKEKLVIAWLREEEWGVDSWLDFVSRILRAMAIEEVQARELLAELKRISIEESIAEAAAHAKYILKEAIGGRTLLLIVENLDDLFKGLGVPGQQQLRSFLQQDCCCTILATTPALFDGVQSREKPFFGFFHTRHLNRLDVPEAIEMLGKLATLGGQEDLARFLKTPLGRSRVRAVHHLAGGNPRVYMLFSQFITRDALDSLVQAFVKMLDDLTPYYQSRMRELSNQQRKIIELLVDKRAAVMVKEIAADCYIDPKTAASQLRDLKNMGYVEATADKRESLYELQEVLMRLCLEVKKQRGTWVEIFVEFLRIWYPLSERKSQLELMRGSSRLMSDEHLERAFLSNEDPCFISSQRDLHRALSEKQQSIAIDTLEELRDNQRLTVEDYQRLLELVKADRYSDVQELLSNIFSQEDRSSEKSNLNLLLDFLTEFELLVVANKNSEALELLDKVLAEHKKFVDVFWCMRGCVLGRSGRHEEAVASFDKSLELEKDNHKVWFLRGCALGDLGRYAEAISSFDKSLEFEPDKHEAWYGRGNSLHRLGRYEEAISSYDKAIKFKPDRDEAWYNRGNSLGYLGRYEEAIFSYDKAIEFKPDDNTAWRNKGFTNFKSGKYIESINCYDRAIAIKSYEYDSWHNKGFVQFVMGNYENALTTWRQAFQIIKQFTPCPNNIAGFIQEFITELIPRFSLPNSQAQLSTFLNQLIPIYQSAQVLPELSTALVNTLPDILAPNISDYTAAEWLALWQNLLGTEPALEMPLRLMKTAIEYKKQPDRQKRLWLELAKEERSILSQALGLAESTAESEI